MPELPEVEVTKMGISPYVENQLIHKVIVRESKLRYKVNAEFCELKNEKINRITRRSKYLVFETSSGSILIHLGMSGSLTLLDKSTPPQKHDHIDIILNNNFILRYNDPRRFGLCLFYKKDQPIALLENLGVEPLSDDFSDDYLFKARKNRTLAIKNYIMDNKVLVGVGNIYACESLFCAKISPLKPVNEVGQAEFEKLTFHIKVILRKSIEQGGTSLKDFVNPDGKPGYFKQTLNVYGRKNKACKVCKTAIESITIGQRNTFFCPSCQR